MSDKTYTCDKCGVFKCDSKSDLKKHLKKCDVTMSSRLNNLIDSINKMFQIQISFAKEITSIHDELATLKPAPLTVTPAEVVVEPVISKSESLIKLATEMTTTDTKLKELDETDKPDPLDLPPTKATNLFIFTLKNGNLFQWKQNEWVPCSNKTVGKLILSNNFTQLL